MNYLVVFLVLFATGTWAQDKVLFADSPHQSLGRTRQALTRQICAFYCRWAMSTCRSVVRVMDASGRS